MSDKYTKLYTLGAYKFSSELECPVSVEAGALLLDNSQGKVLAQVKYKNLTNKSIKSITVDMLTYDGQGNKITGISDYVYKNLIAGSEETFGDKNPVFMADNNTRSFNVTVTYVEFSDGSHWSKDGKVLSNNAKMAAEIGKEVSEKAIEASKKAGKKTVKLVSLIINIAVTALCGLMTIVGLGSFIQSNGTESWIPIALLFLATIISVPGLQKLVFRKKYGKKQKFIRWGVFILIFVLTLITM